MLFDLQLTYWPGEGLERALSMQRMRLEDEPKNSVRRVFGPEGELVMEVRYLDGFLAPGDISIDHFDRPYRLLINTLEPGKNS
jgi:archaeosine-15-forming tRNA-guanine transglycosylase